MCLIWTPTSKIVLLAPSSLLGFPSLSHPDMYQDMQVIQNVLCTL